MRTDFYYLQVKDAPETGVAEGAVDPVFELPIEASRLVPNWRFVSLPLVSGGLTDFLANNLGLRICSTRLRRILDAGKHETDPMQWLPMEVTAAASPVPYWVLHLPEVLDVLDRQRSLIVRDTLVVKAVLDLRKVGRHRIFSFPSAATRMVVHGDVRQAVLTEACTGIDFERVATSQPG